jgi:hypothetical protein
MPQYELFIELAAHKQRQQLPGQVRQLLTSKIPLNWYHTLWNTIWNIANLHGNSVNTVLD